MDDFYEESEDIYRAEHHSKDFCDECLEGEYCKYTDDSLDLSKNTALRILECGKCHLTDLDISNNVNLLFRYEWGGVVFYCGNQYDESGNIKPLTLHITSDQQSQWEDIKWEVGNENVTEVIK